MIIFDVLSTYLHVAWGCLFASPVHLSSLLLKHNKVISYRVTFNFVKQNHDMHNEDNPFYAAVSTKLSG